MSESRASYFSQTTDAIALKIHTLIGHSEMTLQDKFQNSCQILTQLCPFLETLVKFYMQDTIIGVAQ